MITTNLVIQINICNVHVNNDQLSKSANLTGKFRVITTTNMITQKREIIKLINTTVRINVLVRLYFTPFLSTGTYPIAIKFDQSRLMETQEYC